MTKPTNCTVCGAPIAQKPTGRPRKYCPPCGRVVDRRHRDLWDDIHRPGRRKAARSMTHVVENHTQRKVKQMSETDEAPLTRREAELARAWRTINAPETPPAPETPAAPAAQPAAVPEIPAGMVPAPVAAAAVERGPQPPPGQAPLRTMADVDRLSRDEMVERMDEIEMLERQAARS